MLRYAVPPYLYPPVPALPAAVAAPPAEVLPPTPLDARAEDTNKCKRFYPQGCASKSFVKKCRKSCHEEWSAPMVVAPTRAAAPQAPPRL